MWWRSVPSVRAVAVIDEIGAPLPTLEVPVVCGRRLGGDRAGGDIAHTPGDGGVRPVLVRHHR